MMIYVSNVKSRNVNTGVGPWTDAKARSSGGRSSRGELPFNPKEGDMVEFKQQITLVDGKLRVIENGKMSFLFVEEDRNHRWVLGPTDFYRKMEEIGVKLEQPYTPFLVQAHMMLAMYFASWDSTMVDLKGSWNSLVPVM